MSLDIGHGQRAALRIQVQELLEQLNDAERALEHEALDQNLRDRIAVRFQRLLVTRRDEVLALRAGLDGGRDLRDAWRELRTIRADTAPLFAESLALLEGGLARGAGIDRGLCRIADALIEQLAQLSECPWDRFTVLDHGERVNTLADVIRLRFPDLTVWGLPVAAHEFGHIVARSLGRGPDGATALRAVERLGTPAPHVGELFADAYATYALGPAYPAACLLARFDPSSTLNVSGTHPASAVRARLCLDVLRRMDAGSGLLRPLGATVDRLASTWGEMVKDATGAQPALEPSAEVRLTATCEVFWDLMELALPGVRYRSWLQAGGLVETLLDATRSARPLTAAPANLRDTLNAAWGARMLGDPDALMPLADWGLRQCATLAQAADSSREDDA